MSDLVIDSEFGPLECEEIDAAELEAGDVFTDLELVSPGRVNHHHLLSVAENVRTGCIAVDPMSSDDLEDDVYFYAPGDTVFKVVASRYGGPDVESREVHHPGQIRYGGMFVQVLRLVAGGVRGDRRDPWPSIVREILDYTEQHCLIDGNNVTEHGFELLDVLDDIYPGMPGWLDNPYSARPL